MAIDVEYRVVHTITAPCIVVPDEELRIENFERTECTFGFFRDGVRVEEIILSKVDVAGLIKALQTWVDADEQ